MADALVQEAREALEGGDWQEGMECLEDLVDSDPGMAAKLYLLYRPQMDQQVAEWAREVVEYQAVFFPSRLLHSSEEALHHQMKAFEQENPEVLREEYNSHPANFKGRMPNADIDNALWEVEGQREFIKFSPKIKTTSDMMLEQISKEIKENVKYSLWRQKRDKERGHEDLVKLTRSAIIKNKEKFSEYVNKRLGPYNK